MKKAISMLLVLSSLFLCSVELVGCQNATPPPELSTIKLDKSNLFDYVSININYSDYSIVHIDEQYTITCRVEISTSPRISNIEFEKTTINYAIDFIALGFDIRPDSRIVSQLDNKGYSNTSFYCYHQSSQYNPTYAFPESAINIADIQSIEGSVVVEVAKNV